MANVKISEISGGEDTNPASSAQVELEVSGVSKFATLSNIIKNVGAAIKTAYEGESDTNAFTDADHTKLDGIETAADVTDATNVNAAGATMNTDSDLSSNSYFVDEDDMSSDSAVKVPSQQSVKAYVDAGNMASQNDTVVADNVTLVENTIHNQTITGLTGSRQNVFPVPSAIGKEITINILDGDADYEMIPIGAATVTLNGGSAATADDKHRLFIENETQTWVSTSLTNWQLAVDGRIPCIAVFERTGSVANGTHSASTDTLIDWNSLPKNVGDCADPTTSLFTVRRDGVYENRGAIAAGGAITDQKFVNVKVWKNGTGGSRVQNASQRQSAATSSSIVGVGFSPKPVDLVDGDTLSMYFNFEEANKGILQTDYSAGGADQLGETSFHAVVEVL